jgi:DNA-directed RNA polymerase specialized sigma subunit
VPSSSTTGAELGMTQAHSLNSAAHMVRDYLQLDGHSVPDSDPFEWHYAIEGLGHDDIRSARAETREAARAPRAAAEECRALARGLKDKGVSGVEIAKILEVSPQRVSQLVNR